MSDTADGGSEVPADPAATRVLPGADRDLGFGASVRPSGPGGSGGYGGWGGGGSGGSGDSSGGGRRWRMAPFVGMVAVVAVLIGAGAVLLNLRSPAAARTTANSTGNARTAAVARGPEHIVSVTPANGSTGANGGADIRVVFSEPLSATSPMPTVTPAIKGTWDRSGSTATFVPDRGFAPRTKVTVQIPGGKAGIRSNGGGRLSAPVTVSYQTGTFSLIRMEQLLAQLGYLPLTWQPLSGAPAALNDPNAQLSEAYSPPQGTYTWKPGYPVQLTSQWVPNQYGVILQGAVMAFEADHGLTMDGVVGSQVWHAMFRALTLRQRNSHGYTYALASQKVPETLTVWHDGKVIFKNLANTGIPASPSQVGTYPVYLKYRFQVMRGTNPNGTKYADPVWWVSYFYQGDAVHYFPRASYGFPQSLGCVELPYGPAKFIWPYLTYGTLVTVTP